MAQILNERELVINRGRNDGVTRGMRFAVLAATPTEVVDPDSKEILGTVDREKIRVEARLVEDKFAVCSTYETKVVGGNPFADMFANPLLGGPRREVPKTLRASGESFPAPISESESYVKVGDRVRQIVT